MDMIYHISIGAIMSGVRFELSRTPNAPVSDAELLADLQCVAETAARSQISNKLYKQFGGKYSVTTFLQRFRTWNLAIGKAGLAISVERDISNERLFENIMHLWEYYGRQPRRAELAPPRSAFSGSPYKRRFGTWMKALERFVEYANSQDRTPPTPTEVASGHRTSRDPSLRLRFRILKRDNFSCRACGASPALTPGLELHVDHIIAWSVGGETIEENLQTLCEACNLGKSNVL
jgi:5-methylcytosine-specific restriction endonuclease McrA